MSFSLANVSPRSLHEACTSLSAFKSCKSAVNICISLSLNMFSNHYARTDCRVFSHVSIRGTCSCTHYICHHEKDAAHSLLFLLWIHLAIPIFYSHVLSRMKDFSSGPFSWNKFCRAFRTVTYEVLLNILAWDTTYWNTHMNLRWYTYKEFGMPSILDNYLKLIAAQNSYWNFTRWWSE